MDVGPAAGEHGGEVLYSGPPEGLAGDERSQTRRYLFGEAAAGVRPQRTSRPPEGWRRLEGITRNNLHGLDVAFPLACMTAVTGVSGSGKPSLVSQALLELVSAHLGRPLKVQAERESDTLADDGEEFSNAALPLATPVAGHIAAGGERIQRLVQLDQKPIGRRACACKNGVPLSSDQMVQPGKGLQRMAFSAL